MLFRSIRQLEERPTEVAVERDEEAIQTAAASARLEAKLEAEKAADAAIAALNREHAEQLQKEMDKAKEAMAERDKLKEQLFPEDFELFTQYQDAEGKAGDIEDADIFIEGFRMGALIVMDVLLKTA